MRLVAEHGLELTHPQRTMWARIYEPVLEPDGETWSCRITISEPFEYDNKIYQVTNMLALVSALQILSVILYSSPDWKQKALGFNGQAGGDLGVPATKYISDVAPYPF